jgi:hypothetical protein
MGQKLCGFLEGKEENPSQRACHVHFLAAAMTMSAKVSFTP